MPTVNGASKVSDEDVRAVLQRIANHFRRNVNVTSGDRGKPLAVGGKKGSLHLRHTAADFHVEGMDDAEAFAELRKNTVAAAIFTHTAAYEFLRHGPHTETFGAHLHLGRYPDPEASKKKAGHVYVKEEGLTKKSKGKYAVVQVIALAEAKKVKVNTGEHTFTTGVHTHPFLAGLRGSMGMPGRMY